MRRLHLLLPSRHRWTFLRWGAAADFEGWHVRRCDCGTWEVRMFGRWRIVQGDAVDLLRRESVPA